MKRTQHKSKHAGNPLTESVMKNVERLVNTLTCQSVVPLPGTPLLVNLAVAIEHSGVYLGNEEVAELHGSGNLRKVSLEGFRDGGDGSAVRTGAFIYAACDKRTGKPLESAGAAEMALTAVGNAKKLSYNILFNNCHLFAATCLLESTPGKWSSGLFTIAGLEEVISARLNQGRPVVWIPIRHSDDALKILPGKIRRMIGKITRKKQ